MAKGKYKKWLTKEGLTLITGWTREGLTDEQLAHNMGITAKTLYEWKNKYSEISKAMAQGKEVIDFIVESAMQKRAEGYDVWEEEEAWSAELNEWIPVKRKKKHIPADTTAASVWLRNRRPDKWRDKPENTIVEEVEDDGLMSALLNVEGIQDDSDSIGEQEDD